MDKYRLGMRAVSDGQESYIQDAEGRRYSAAEAAGYVRETHREPTAEHPVVRFYKPHIQPNGSAYSDRLYSWDTKKYDELCQKHFGNKGHWWDHRTPAKIEAFLRDYNELKTLELSKIEHQINYGNGFPLWYFEYHYDEQELAVLMAAREAASAPDD